MSLTKIIAAAASCIFVFLMMPATAGVKAGDGRMTANDKPGGVVVEEDGEEADSGQVVHGAGEVRGPPREHPLHLLAEPFAAHLVGGIR